MSMIMMFRRLSDADLARLREEPELVAEYIGEADLDGFGPFADLDIDKAWHAIHFLLTGTAWEGEPRAGVCGNLPGHLGPCGGGGR